MKIKEETIQKVIILFKEKKYTKRYIASECGCSVDSIDRILERAGLKEKKLSDKLKVISKEVEKSFLEGMYCKDIAKKFNINDHSVYKILDVAGIPRQSGYHTNCDTSYFEQINTPNKAYLLGFITADGAIVNEVLSIEVHQKDIELLEFAKSEINPKATITPTRKCVKISLSAKKIGRDLAKYGIIQNKSKILEKVPEDLIPLGLLKFYFRGLIDGDGCIHKNGRISIYSGSLPFIKDVQRILIREAGVSQLKIYKGTVYSIAWGSKEDRVKLFNYLYSNLEETFYYKRKYNRLLEFYNHVNTEVID